MQMIFNYLINKCIVRSSIEFVLLLIKLDYDADLGMMS